MTAERQAYRSKPSIHPPELAEDLRMLLAVVNSGKRLDDILLTICQQASHLLRSLGSQIFLPAEDDPASLVVSSASSSLEGLGRVVLPRNGSAVGLSFTSRRPVAVCDVDGVYSADAGPNTMNYEDQGDHLEILCMPRGQAENVGAFIEQFHSLLAVPLVVKNEAYGVLVLPYHATRSFSSEEISLALAFADQAAMAVENARLHDEAAERTLELESMLDVSRAIASTLDLDELVRLILLQLQSVVNYSAASLILIEDGALVVHDLVAPGKPDSDLSAVGVRFPLDGLGDAWRNARSHPSTLDYPCVQVAASPEFWSQLEGGTTVVIPDVLSAPGRLAEDYRITMGDLLFAPEFDFMRSWMAVPLLPKDRVIGYIGVASEKPGYFTKKHIRLAQAFADHVSIAIENARLYESAQRLAAIDERQRLARDLHDSVAQALYGIALGAKTARKYVEPQDVAVAEPLDYVVSLAAAGLAEMRALIFDLHPDSLANEGLVKAVARQVHAVQARYGISVSWHPVDEPDLPLPHKEAVYSIIREALHNVVKHSQAQGVQLSFGPVGREFRFSVTDDGIGFCPAKVPSGHLGLQSMRERVEKLAGMLVVESTPGAGTSIQGSVPLT